MRLLLLIILLFSASPVFAAASCAPVSTDARILSSADSTDVHPDWSDGSQVGLSWSLELQGDEEGRQWRVVSHRRPDRPERQCGDFGRLRRLDGVGMRF